MSRRRYPAVCVVCKRDFFGSKRTAKCCSKTCTSRNNPIYVRNSELIKTCDFYLSLGFTPEQVFDDYVKDYFKPETFIRMLDRRKESDLARQFRPMAPRPGWSKAA